MLDADDSTGVHAIFHLTGHDSVDFDLQFVAVARGSIGVPVIPLQGTTPTGAECIFTFFVPFNRADEPEAA
jgi:hypothetical protein